LKSLLSITMRTHLINRLSLWFLEVAARSSELFSF
jgi:hypothetical protein